MDKRNGAQVAPINEGELQAQKYCNESTMLFKAGRRL